MYFRKVLTTAQVIIAYSNYVAEYFRRSVGDGKPIHVLANGVESTDCGAQPALDTPSDRALTIAYCGTVAEHKGPHIMLEALKAAALPSVNILIIGQSPQCEFRKRLRETAAAIPGLTLRMYGKYERNELSFLLRDVDCLIAPSLVPEAGPIVPREALALGVPILVARLGALPELIAEGENGFTFDPNRPAELAAILRRMADDKTLLAHLRAGARRSAVVTVAEHTDRVRQLYIEAIAHLSSRPADEADSSGFNFVHESLVALGCDRAIQ
jgi:glycosyltransferase involved in cell wall biosynthesis